MSSNLKRSLKGSDWGSGYVATFPELSTADRTQQISWERLLNQDITLSWLVAHATVYCGNGSEHIAYSSAKARAKQKPEASPEDCAFLVIR